MSIPHAVRIAMVVLSGTALLMSGFSCTCAHRGVAAEEDIRPDGGERHPQGSPGYISEDSNGELWAWREGVRAFETGAHEKALSLFEALNQNGSTEELRLRALYALACTRLVMANDREELNSAMGLLDQWCRSAHGDLHDEESRLMILALRHLAGSLASSQAAAVKPAPAPKETVRIIRDRDCDVLLRSKDKDIQNLRQQIGVLKHQIEALEKIHREIQEKKEQVSPP